MPDLDVGLRLDGRAFAVPIDAAAARFVVMGKSGAGKTNAGAVLIEEFVRAGVPTIVLDPLGNQWGLRSSADGEGAGLPIAIFGGTHGDVPLPADRATYVADLLAEGVSAVLDFSLMAHEEMVDFANALLPRLLRRATMNLHVVLEEADRFAPQRAVSSPVTMWSRASRNGGIGWTFSTQKPQVLHKEVIDSASVFVAMRMTGELAQDAVGGEIGSRIGMKSAKKMMAELATFARGDAWFVPESDWLGPEHSESEPERIRFRLRRTFEVRPPRVGEQRREPKMLAAIDLDRLRETIVDDVEMDESDDADPELVHDLRARIANLERDLDAYTKAVTIARQGFSRISLVIEEMPSLMKAVIELAGSTSEATENLAASSQGVSASIAADSDMREGVFHEEARGYIDRATARLKRQIDAQVPTAPLSESTESSESKRIAGGPLRTLQSLARLGGRTSKIRLKVVTGIAERTLSNHLGVLRADGYIVDESLYNVAITPIGAALTTDAAAQGAPTAREIIEKRYVALTGSRRGILDALVAAHPNALKKAGLREAFEIAERTLSNILSELRGLSLVVNVSSAMVRASDDLFPGGKA